MSFFNGFFEYDVATDRISRVKTLPKNPATSEDRTTWVNDSRHHGITMKPDGAKLCVAGTMDDYATVVDRDTFEHGLLVPVAKPYWATVSGDGESCVVSRAAPTRSPRSTSRRARRPCRSRSATTRSGCGSGMCGRAGPGPRAADRHPESRNQLATLRKAGINSPPDASR